MRRSQIVFGAAGLVCIVGVIVYLKSENVDDKTAGLWIAVAGFLVAAGARFAAGLKETK